MPGSIGVKFLPSEEQSALGPQQGARESDLGQAFKILSLNLRRSPDVRGIAPQRLLQSPGSGALPSGMNPLAAVVQALLRASQAGQPTPFGDLGQAIGAPKVIPGGPPQTPDQANRFKAPPDVIDRTGSIGTPRNPGGGMFSKFLDPERDRAMLPY